MQEGKRTFFAGRRKEEKIHETFMISPCSPGEEWDMIDKTTEDRGEY